MTSDDRLARIERRYERERRARLEAEAIAEAGLRQLSELNASLDERIRERTAELEAATARAEAANEAKDDFLSHVSHELRTPINGITGMLELLEAEVRDAPATDWLAAARESGDRLLRLVERLLWFTDLQSSDLAADAEEMRVQEIVEVAGDRWRLPCAKAGQLLSVEPTTSAEATVWATPAINRALDELLDNVVAHVSAGAVRLTARVEGDLVMFEVIDDGEGLPEGAIGILDTGESATTRRGTGAGIGLALATTVAESLGGSLGSASRDDGHAVWISVPTQPAQDQDSGAANR